MSKKKFTFTRSVCGYSRGYQIATVEAETEKEALDKLNMGEAVIEENLIRDDREKEEWELDSSVEPDEELIDYVVASLKEALLCAKEYIEQTPCDPDVFPDQHTAWLEYQDSINYLKEKGLIND